MAFWSLFRVQEITDLGKRGLGGPRAQQQYLDDFPWWPCDIHLATERVLAGLCGWGHRFTNLLGTYSQSGKFSPWRNALIFPSVFLSLPHSISLQGLTVQARLASNSESPDLSFPNVGMTGICYHTWPVLVVNLLVSSMYTKGKCYSFL